MSAFSPRPGYASDPSPHYHASIGRATDRDQGYTPMRPSQQTSRLPAALLACIALGLPGALLAQEQPGLSSGSGAGTGSGRSAGIQRNPSGSASGVGPERMRQAPGGYAPLPPTSIRPSQSIPAGPGVNVRFPDDPA